VNSSALSANKASGAGQSNRERRPDERGRKRAITALPAVARSAKEGFRGDYPLDLGCHQTNLYWARTALNDSNDPERLERFERFERSERFVSATLTGWIATCSRRPSRRRSSTVPLCQRRACRGADRRPDPGRACLRGPVRLDRPVRTGTVTAPPGPAAVWPPRSRD
jgi:hypothetical protein